MPINKNVGKLWFKTQEEIDAYDDKMVANIYLKEEDPEKPSYSIIAARPKKENFFEYNEKAKESIAKYEQLKRQEKPIFGTYKYFYEKSLYKIIIGGGLGYLLLREIPIKNFYARSVMWATIAIYTMENYKFSPLSLTVSSRYYVKAPEHYFNQFNLFEYYHKASSVLPSATNQGISAYDQWKLEQPGFFNHNSSSIMTHLQAKRKK